MEKYLFQLNDVKKFAHFVSWYLLVLRRAITVVPYLLKGTLIPFSMCLYLQPADSEPLENSYFTCCILWSRPVFSMLMEHQFVEYCFNWFGISETVGHFHRFCFCWLSISIAVILLCAHIRCGSHSSIMHLLVWNLHCMITEQRVHTWRVCIRIKESDYLKILGIIKTWDCHNLHKRVQLVYQLKEASFSPPN